MNLYLGLMSGTSMDGVDVALFDAETLRLINSCTYLYSEKTRLVLQKICNTKPLLWEEVYGLNKIIGEEFAAAANSLLQTTAYKASDIKAIGNHGQTIAHDASALVPYTLQIACSHTIAERTGIAVVSDFRTRDLVLGGKGAPLAPLFHAKLFEEQKKPVVVINIGGIANLSFITDNIITGYDIGPGNCLLDAWIFQHQKKFYDAEGRWANTGKVLPGILNSMLREDFFKKSKPKSIGKEYFSLTWLNKYLSGSEEPEDVQATLLALTVELLAKAVLSLEEAPEDIFICGGGAHNTALMQSLQSKLEYQVKSTKEIGLNPDHIEASMCAWLAHACMNNLALNCEQITGAKHPAIYGVIYPI